MECQVASEDVCVAIACRRGVEYCTVSRRYAPSNLCVCGGKSAVAAQGMGSDAVSSDEYPIKQFQVGDESQVE